MATTGKESTAMAEKDSIITAEKTSMAPTKKDTIATAEKDSTITAKEDSMATAEKDSMNTAEKDYKKRGRNFAEYGYNIHIAPLLPRLYVRERDHHIAVLKTLCQNVEAPIEAPEMTEYKTIEILVNSTIAKGIRETLRGTDDFRGLRKAIIEIFKADIYIRLDEYLDLALPHPSVPKSFMRVNIQIITSEAKWRWILFMRSHEPMWPLIRRAIKPVGLHLSWMGLCVQDPIMGWFRWTRSNTLLSINPEEVLDLLGYKESEFWGRKHTYGAKRPTARGKKHTRGIPGLANPSNEEETGPFRRVNPASFATWNDLNAFVMGCRFFREDRYVPLPSSLDDAEGLRKMRGRIQER